MSCARGDGENGPRVFDFYDVGFAGGACAGDEHNRDCELSLTKRAHDYFRFGTWLLRERGTWRAEGTGPMDYMDIIVEGSSQD